jgi:serine/threonine protein kinase
MKCTDRKRDCGVVTSPKLKILGKGNYGEISKIKYHNEYYAAKSSDFMDGLMDVSVGVLLKHPNVLDIENVRTHYDCEKINGLFFTSGVYIPANKILGTIEPNKAILDVVTGLRALEKIDCYHFDLKLPNLLYNSETGNILVADLGGCHFMIRKKERVGIWVSSTQHHAPLSIYSSLRNFKITYSHSVFALGILAAEFVLAEEFDILHLGHDRTIYNETLSESKNTREQIKFLERGLKKSTGLCSELISQSIECLKDRYYLYKVKPL